jgi:hypothetical protein
MHTTYKNPTYICQEISTGLGEQMGCEEILTGWTMKIVVLFGDIFYRLFHMSVSGLYGI